MASFKPTHHVPADGAATWPKPDPKAKAGPRLAANLLVRVDEQRGAWAHVICSNKWTGWMDGRVLVPIQGSPPSAEPDGPPAAPPAGVQAEAQPQGAPVVAAPPVAAPAPPVAAPAPPVAAPPAPVAAPSAARPAGKSRGSGGGCLRGCLLILILIVLVVGGGAVVLTSGLLTPDGIMTLVGRGPGYVAVSNLRDNSIRVALEAAGPDATGSSGVTIGSLDLATLKAPEPGRFKLTVTAGGTQLAACTLTVKSGDRYQIVLLPATTIVRRGTEPVGSGAELIVATSSLCR